MTKRLINHFLVTFLLVSLTGCMRAKPAEQKPVEAILASPVSIPAQSTEAVSDPAQPVISGTTVPAGILNREIVLNVIPGNFQFTEGPAVDGGGNVYFSDVDAGKIYKWSTDGSTAVFLEGLSGPNGLMFDRSGNLIACEGGDGRIILIDQKGTITVLAEQYNGTRFNEPNDLWIDAQNGIYFTDPVYKGSLVQDGQHVYYLSPDRLNVTRVTSDLVQPNGIVGSADGKTLFIADLGAGQIFSYTIQAPGILADKKLFIPFGSDGMELDGEGNLYITVQNKVLVFNNRRMKILEIPAQENPTNIAFAGKDGQSLFITARTEVYVSEGVQAQGSSTTKSQVSQGFSLSSPDLEAGNRLPTEYTCDGDSSTLALNWSGEPVGTKSFALIMHHVAGPGDVHWYWVLYNIPSDVQSLVKNSSGIGMLGTNSVNKRPEYTPPCSKGPGDKVYTYTVYALSEAPAFTVSADQVNRDALLAAMQGITLGSAELIVVYASP